MDKSKEMEKEEYRGTMIDYGSMIIELVQQIDKGDYKFLKQVYTIIHRHILKRGS